MRTRLTWLSALVVPAVPALASLMVLAVPALADDGIAGLGNGGLVLEKTDKIELRSEELYLSTKEIRISYRFFNNTGQDLPATIAFPLPDITGSQEIDVDIPNPNDANFLKFKTKVDGKPIVSTIEQRAFLTAEGKQEEEITGRLKEIGVPLMPTVQATAAVIAKLPADKLKALTDKQILEANTFDDGKGAKTEYVPLWTLRAKFVRPQVFPAGKEILVEQRYQPSIDTTSGVYLTKGSTEPETLEHNRKTFCTDDDFLKSAGVVEDQNKARLASNSTAGLAVQESLAYVITSGANWAGPIGDFRLVVDKGHADNLVSFCADGVKKISPTQFEVKIKDYLPTRDINVLFVEKHH